MRRASTAAGSGRAGRRGRCPPPRAGPKPGTPARSRNCSMAVAPVGPDNVGQPVDPALRRERRCGSESSAPSAVGLGDDQHPVGAAAVVPGRSAWASAGIRSGAAPCCRSAARRSRREPTGSRRPAPATRRRPVRVIAASPLPPPDRRAGTASGSWRRSRTVRLISPTARSVSWISPCSSGSPLCAKPTTGALVWLTIVVSCSPSFRVGDQGRLQVGEGLRHRRLWPTDQSVDRRQRLIGLLHQRRARRQSWLERRAIRAGSWSRVSQQRPLRVGQELGQLGHRAAPPWPCPRHRRRQS